MKKYILLLACAIVCVTSLHSFADPEEEAQNDDEKYISAYEIKDADLHDLYSGSDISSSTNVGHIGKGSKFRVYEFKELADGTKMANIRVNRLPDDKSSQMEPSDNYWINMTDMSDYRLYDTYTEADDNCPLCKKKKEQNEKNLSAMLTEMNKSKDDYEWKPMGGKYDAAIMKYSNSAKVKNTIEFASKNSTGKSKGKCYRYVKEGLACGKKGRKGSGKCLTNSWYGDTAALHGKEALKQYGFVNLLDSEPYKSKILTPAQAPRGAVLVYSSGIPCKGTRIKDCGHIEVKTGLGGDYEYVSDYHSGRAVNWRVGSRYKLKAVMIQTEDKK